MREHEDSSFQYRRSQQLKQIANPALVQTVGVQGGLQTRVTYSVLLPSQSLQTVVFCKGYVDVLVIID